MENKCFRQTLLGNVENDNIPLFGCFLVKKEASDTFSAGICMAIRANGAVEISLRRGHFTDSAGNIIGTTKTLVNNVATTVFFSNEEAVLDIPKANIVQVDFFTPAKFKTIGCSYMPLLIKVENMFIRNISEYNNWPSIQTINNTFASDTMLGSLSDISELTTLTKLVLTGNVIMGKITDLSKMTLLTHIVFPNKITGSIEDFVRSQRANGRNSASNINIPYINSTQITFKGSRLGAGGTFVLSWQPNSSDTQNTDVTFNGETITINP